MGIQSWSVIWGMPDKARAISCCPCLTRNLSRASSDKLSEASKSRAIKFLTLPFSDQAFSTCIKIIWLISQATSNFIISEGLWLTWIVNNIVIRVLSIAFRVMKRFIPLWFSGDLDYLCSRSAMFDSSHNGMMLYLSHAYVLYGL